MSGALKRDEWETVRLGDEMKSMPRVLIPDVLYFQEGPGVRNTQYTLSGVKLLNVSNLHDGFVDLSTSNRYISEDEAYGRYSHFLVDEGDFIIASSGIKIESFDTKMGFIDKSHLPLCMNTSTIRFKVLDDSKLSIRYFMYYLKSDDFKKQLFHHITGSAQLNFGPSHLKKMTFPLPPLDVQRRIADTLDKVTELITLRKTQLEKLDELVKARFVEMFGDPMVNQKGWITDIMKSVCTKITDGEHGSVLRVDTGNVFLNAKHIRKDGLIDWETVTYVTDEVHNKIYSRCNPEYGDVLLTTTGTIGNVTLVPNVPPFSLDRGITLLKLDKSKVNNKFIVGLLSFDSIQSVMKANIHASAIGHLFLNKVMKIPIIVPPLELQNEFAAFVEQTDKSKVIIQQSLDTLETLKKSLMQEYFG